MRFRLFALILFFTSPAFAGAVEPGKEGPLADILPPNPGEHICFKRSYDEAHLKAHPKQTVKEIEFRLAYYRFDPEENYPQGQRNYYFDLLVKRKGEAKTASGGGECSVYEGRIFCGIDCDGGGIYLKKSADGINLDFGEMWGISMSSECGGGEEGGADLVPGEDDKEFRLTRIEACPAYEEW